MGHITSQGIYGNLRKRLDANIVGAPDSPVLRDILSILFTPEEAEIAVKMPYGFVSSRRLSEIVGIPESVLLSRLDAMTAKGLVFDVERGKKRYCALNPLVIGFFEFSMMRIRTEIDQKDLARKIHEYMFEDPSEAFLREVATGKTSLFRPLVHENVLAETSVEVLDYDRATHVVKSARAVSKALCHCRHVAKHRDNPCKYPLEICLSMNTASEYLVRHGMAKAISTEEGLDILEEARRLGLVQLGDNIRQRVLYICNCCSCCCGILEGYRRFKDTVPVVTSNFVPSFDAQTCSECGLCSRVCPIGAIEVIPIDGHKRLSLDERICLGCGVCGTKCRTGSIRMKNRARRVHTPRDTMERLVLMALERGKLQNLLFDEPEKFSHRALRRFLGVLLALPPQKQLLANQQIRSRFVERTAKKYASRARGV